MYGLRMRPYAHGLKRCRCNRRSAQRYGAGAQPGHRHPWALVLGLLIGPQVPGLWVQAERTALDTDPALARLDVPVIGHDPFEYLILGHGVFQGGRSKRVPRGRSKRSTSRRSKWLCTFQRPAYSIMNRPLPSMNQPVTRWPSIMSPSSTSAALIRIAVPTFQVGLVQFPGAAGAVLGVIPVRGHVDQDAVVLGEDIAPALCTVLALPRLRGDLHDGYSKV